MIHAFDDLRSNARSKLIGNYSLCFLALMAVFLLISILNQALALFPVFSSFAAAYTEDTILSFFVTLLMVLLRVGLLFLCLNIARRGRANLADLFLAFRYESGRAFSLCAILSLIEMIVTLPMDYVVYSLFARGYLALPGGLRISGPAPCACAFAVSLLLSGILEVLLAFPYSQSAFLYIDHQEYSAAKCLRQSKTLMRGQMLRYLWLHLSLLGYFLLTLLTFGLGLVWVLPYLYVTRAEYYMELTGNYHPY